MIQNPSVGGVVIDELFAGQESNPLAVLVGNYRFLLVLYSNYQGTIFTQVGHVPIDLIKVNGNISIGDDGSGSELLNAQYGNGEVTFSPTFNGAIYAVYGIV